MLESIPKSRFIDSERGVICSDCQERIRKLHVQEKKFKKSMKNFESFTLAFELAVLMM